MIPPLAELIPPDRLISLHLANGHILLGRCTVVGGGWILVVTRDAERLVNLAHVAVIDLHQAGEMEAPPEDGALPKPTSKDIPVKVGSKAPGRPWSDADLKSLSEGYLDGVLDGELAKRHNRARTQITLLRQAFECQRGNLVEDQMNPGARLWIDRWRRVLAAQ